MKYTPFEMEKLMASMVILVDTREHPNKKFEKRVASFGYPWERTKLDFGDYSCKYTDLDGNEVSMANVVAVERKMGLDELSVNLAQERKRFAREFERAQNAGARIHLIVENASYDKIINGDYRTQFNSKAYLNSLLAWQTRYDMRFHTVNEEYSGRLIASILRFELRQFLEANDNEQ